MSLPCIGARITRSRLHRVHRCGERVVESLEARRLLATFMVTNTNDSGAGSLRSAINNANLTGIPDVIEFNFAVAGVRSIGLLSPLPTIDWPLTIDGSTMPFFTGTPQMYLGGGAAGGGTAGLTITNGACTIKGLGIVNFAGHGIVIQSNNCTITSCYIGNNGNSALPNSGHGILVDGDNNTIGGNSIFQLSVISGNGGNGIYVDAGATGNTIRGCAIGTDDNRNAAIPNGLDGIHVRGDSNTIGSTDVFQSFDNTISGNVGSGIFLDGVSNTVIADNSIGTQSNGFGSIPNGGRGIHILGGIGAAQANDNYIGSTAFAYNHISNNVGAGIEIDKTLLGGASGNTIQGNKFRDNGGLAIDLIGTVNGSQPAPTITSVSRDLESFRVNVSLSGAAGFAPNTSYRIEIFNTGPGTDPSGFGEAQYLCGSTTILTDATGAGSAEITSTFDLLNVPHGDYITALATNETTGDTSEFAANVQLRDIEVFGTASADNWFVRNDNSETTLRIYQSPDTSGDLFEFDKSLVDSITFHGGDGDDHVYIDLGNGEILPVSSDAFTFNGDVGTADTLHIQGSVNNDVFTSAASAFIVGTNTYHYGTIEAAALDGAFGNDTFNIGSTNLTTYGLATTILGGNGTNDALVLADSSGAAIELYGITSTTISNTTASNVPLFGGIIYDSTLEGILLSAGGGPSLVNIASLSAGVTLTVLGNGGADSFTVGGGNLDTIAGTVNINGGGGTTDSVTLSDYLNTINDTFTINALNVTRPRFGGLNILNAEALTVLGGTSASTFNVTHNSSAASLSVDTGNGTDTINIIEANGTQPVALIPSAGGDSVNVNSDVVGTAIAVISGSATLGGLNVNNGGTLTVATSGTTLLTVKAMSLGASGKLDLNDNDLAVTNNSWSLIEGYVRDAYNFGDWLGARGIFSSSAKHNPIGNTTLGVLSGQEFIDNNGGTFDGRTVVASDVLVKYTYFGDVDFSGSVDVSDYNLIDFGFVNGSTTWAYGDADHSGGVDASDYNVIDFAFATQSGAL